RSTAAAICAQNGKSARLAADSNHYRCLAIPLPARALDSANLLLSGIARPCYRRRAVLADHGSCPPFTIAFFLCHGSWVFVARDATRFPTSPVLRNGVASEWDRHLGVASGSVARQHPCGAWQEFSPATLDFWRPACRFGRGLLDTV